MIAPMLTAYPAPGAPGIVVKPVWIDLLQPTAEERDRIASEYGLRVPSREALQEIESSSRLRPCLRSGSTLCLPRLGSSCPRPCS
jgi:magnesium transporter